MEETMQQEPIFEEHLELKDAQKKVKEGKLFEGKYMAEKSYFKIGKTMHKIKLENNRAMFGDVVAIEISPVETWEKKIKTLEVDDVD